ncbi:MAG TPA: tRNA (N(6)-L-threonylcarbamoyladenosine(37)-C(2))-methylthiotransferase MtaB [Defluviitaleaceae bacterium]|jgi:threonylcarbamoyladenosine tRNA methylthiotransferase MtaB|nr:tRNA (N(6)-L-threonylcarbamoyladenosine(37)-C(2))-methylthiotransferase MtaB [Candidatus Epulonipiscium sp.]HOQ17333.1 tRNA (N(6)-L-threonylcarbamoyladenosine(37)-C(2))-methylthiotransferase MtaB [Defluviitaleaceae bacterium]HPT75391.1 tRNA (N(6)-L-threonylcarbamoyladenosine(37)-C(2))-methylthiotransferase MtaB [Defluviitaleaceae bacterium]HQD50513.1 tRNA (N(6)-L-threonylcarbamoyladenosine(37)-C(2))-methylthiotransferase MtaB [Defluviitaleaceae bacterium]
MATAAFYTLGCKVNQYETEALIELFKDRGYEIVDFGDYADVYVINTCTVTNLGDRKSRQMIRKAKKMNPSSIVAVVGCYVQVAPEKVKAIEEVNIIIGTDERHRIAELIEQYKEEQKNISLVKNIMKVKEFEELSVSKLEGRTRAYLKIQEGCNQFCSYCIIPYARGPVRSRKPENIINEVNKLVYNGFKEIVLTGIHVASYGKDLGNINLLKLLEMVHTIKGLERIRLSSIEPSIVNEEFVNTIQGLHKICPHFHLSLQSGCDETLKRMNRKYTTKDYKEAVELLRDKIEDIALTTDIIVGFPGENDEEFNQSYHFVKEIAFSQIHVFKFSPRQGTPAARMKDQIAPEVKEERSRKMIELGQFLQNQFLVQQIGKTMDVLFENTLDDHEEIFEGHTPNYLKVEVHSKEDIKNQILPVTFQGIKNHSLIGNIKN